MIYIASPYSDQKPSVRDRRYLAVRRYVADTVKKEPGVFRFSPIMYHHISAIVYHLPKDALFWEEHNREVFRYAKSMEVLMLPGWEDSVGVNMELAWAVDEKIEVVYVEPSEAVRELADGIRQV